MGSLADRNSGNIPDKEVEHAHPEHAVIRYGCEKDDRGRKDKFLKASAHRIRKDRIRGLSGRSLRIFKAFEVFRVFAAFAEYRVFAAFAEYRTFAALAMLRTLKLFKIFTAFRTAGTVST